MGSSRVCTVGFRGCSHFQVSIISIAWQMFCGIKSNDSPVCSFKLHIWQQQKPDSLHPLVFCHIWWNFQNGECNYVRLFPDGLTDVISDFALEHYPDAPWIGRIYPTGFCCSVAMWSITNGWCCHWPGSLDDPQWYEICWGSMMQYTNYTIYNTYILAMLCLHFLWSWSTGPISMCLWFI